MQISTSVNYAGDIVKAADTVAALESAGIDTVWIAEAYSFDAVSLMGYLAAKTSKVNIGSGILNIYSRTPSCLGQTAAGLDAVTNGRAILGLGASGPQVIEGFHGVPYDKPLARTREIIEICRMMWRREPVTHTGIYNLPLPEGQGTGLGKALKLINHPVRVAHPDLHRGDRQQERRDDRRARRWLAADLLHARPGQRRVGRGAQGRRGQAVSRPAPARRRRRRSVRDRRGPRGRARLHASAACAVHRRHGRPRQELLQRTRVPLRLRERGEGNSGPLSRRQQEGSGGGLSPPRCSRA